MDLKFRHTLRFGAIFVSLVLSLLVCSPAHSLMEECGNELKTCECGDYVTTDYTMTADLGPCQWEGGIEQLVGLWVNPGVELDCNGHTVTGPNDSQKEEFGIRVTGPQNGQTVTVKNCHVTGFWWGIYVKDSDSVLVDNVDLIENGWKDPTQNGTGYGIDIANSISPTFDVIFRNSRIIDNGNEGLHLSHSSGVRVENNFFEDNGLEQVYLIHADGNQIVGNTASGGTQGLEMRWSDDNAFSNNIWAGSAKQWLENDNTGNTFVYEHFEGRVAINKRSHANRFDLCSFEHSTKKWCVQLKSSSDNYFYKAHFADCEKELKGTKNTTLDRAVGAEKVKPKKMTILYPSCNADIVAPDGVVDAADGAVIDAAQGSVVGGPGWNPEADLNHDGTVDAADSAEFNAQSGSCEDVS